MTKFTMLFRLLWFLTIISILFINTESKIMVYSVILMLLILTSITVIRALESRNQWRRMIEDGDVEVKDKILECFMYISVVGLGVTAAEKFGKK